MAWHLGPGPIFVNECVLTARRWQTFFVRGLTGLLLLGLVALVYNSTIESIRLETSSSLAEQARARDNIGQALMTSILVLQLVMVIFVAPATMAGAICIEKARGTLLHLLVTDLRSHEIILGKLAARFLHIFGLIGISLPIFLILTTVVSIEPEMVLGGYMVLVGVAVLYSAMSLTVSVYGQKPHEVLVASMLLVVLLLLLGPAWVLFVSIVTARDSAGLIIVGGIAALVAFIVMLVASPAARQSVGSFLVRMLAFLILVALCGGVIDYLRETLPAQATNWLMPTNPFYIAFYRYINPNDPDALLYQGVFLIVHLGLAGLLVLGCTLRLRAVAISQASRGDAPKPRPAQKALAEQPADTATAATADAAALPRADAVDRPSLWQRLLARLPGPGLDGNPVLWREWHRRRPSRLMRGLWAFVAFVAIFFSVLSFLSIMFISLSGNGFGGNPLAVVTVTGIVFVGLLLVSIASVGSLLEERQRGSLDVLLTTPLSTGQIIWGKWLGAYRTALALLLLPILLLCWQAAWTTIIEPLESQSNFRFGLGIVGGYQFSAFELWARVLAMSCLFLSWGAWVTTVGLAAAVFVRRIALATLVSVGLYVALTIGVPMLLVLLAATSIARDSDWFNCILVGTPLGGTGYLSSELFFSSPLLRQTTALITQAVWVWSGYFALASLLVYRLIWVHFNRLFGRIDPPRGAARLLAMPSSREQSRRQPVTAPATPAATA